MESGSTVDITVLKPNDMIAASLRFDGALNVDLKEFQTPYGGAGDSKSRTNFGQKWAKLVMFWTTFMGCISSSLAQETHRCAVVIISSEFMHFSSDYPISMLFFCCSFKMMSRLLSLLPCLAMVNVSMMS